MRNPFDLPQMEPLDWRIIDLILSGAERRPWSGRELAAIFGDKEAVDASLRRLYYTELIERIGIYAMPSIAAITSRQLAERFGSEAPHSSEPPQSAGATA